MEGFSLKSLDELDSGFTAAKKAAAEEKARENKEKEASQAGLNKYKEAPLDERMLNLRRVAEEEAKKKAESAETAEESAEKAAEEITEEITEEIKEKTADSANEPVPEAEKESAEQSEDGGQREKRPKLYDRIEKNVYVEKLDDNDFLVSSDFVEDFDDDDTPESEPEAEKHESAEPEEGEEGSAEKIVYVPSDRMQVKDTLLPKYKPAPMNKMTDMPRPEPENPDSPAVAEMPVSMPKEYAPIQPGKPRHIFRGFAKIVICIVMAVTVFFSATGAVFSAMKNDIAYWMFGHYVCSAEQTTCSPVLTKGDLVFVHPVKEDEIKNGMAVAYLDTENNFYRYAIVVDGGGEKELILGTMDENQKTSTKAVQSAYVIGEPKTFIPKVFSVLDRFAPHRTAAIAAAALIVLVCILLLIIMKVKGKKK